MINKCELSKISPTSVVGGAPALYLFWQRCRFPDNMDSILKNSEGTYTKCLVPATHSYSMSHKE